MTADFSLKKQCKWEKQLSNIFKVLKEKQANLEFYIQQKSLKIKVKLKYKSWKDPSPADLWYKVKGSPSHRSKMTPNENGVKSMKVNEGIKVTDKMETLLNKNTGETGLGSKIRSFVW